MKRVSDTENPKAVRSAGGLMTRLAECRAGAVALEFALGFPIFIALVYGLFEFGRIFWSQNTLEYAIEEAARYAVVNTSATAGEITTIVANKATGLDPARINVNVSFEQDNSGTGTGPRTFVTIAGRFAYQPILPLQGLVAFDITTSTRMAVVQ